LHYNEKNPRCWCHPAADHPAADHRAANNRSGGY